MLGKVRYTFVCKYSINLDMAQKSYTIGIRLDKVRMAEIIKAAKKENRTRSNWVLVAISEKLERDGKGN